MSENSGIGCPLLANVLWGFTQELRNLNYNLYESALDEMAVLREQAKNSSSLSIAQHLRGFYCVKTFYKYHLYTCCDFFHKKTEPEIKMCIPGYTWPYIDNTWEGLTKLLTHLESEKRFMTVYATEMDLSGVSPGTITANTSSTVRNELAKAQGGLDDGIEMTKLMRASLSSNESRLGELGSLFVLAQVRVPRISLVHSSLQKWIEYSRNLVNISEDNWIEP